MRNKEVKDKLKTAISNSVPNALEDILKKCENKKGFENKMKEVQNEKKKGFFVNSKLIAVCTMLIVVLLVVGGINRYNNVYRVDSTIEFDVNPSIELEINKNEEIIKVIALNDDAKKVLKGMDLNNVDLDVAVNAIIGSMLKNGYISATQNSILVSVKSDDVEKGNALQTKLSKEINEILSASSIKGSVLTQSYDENKKIKEVAEKNNVSEGKAKLINNILTAGIKDTKGNLYTFEALSQLSINELNLLLTSKNTKVENVHSSGTASEESYIGKEKAQEIAFKDAQTSVSKVKDLEVELDADYGVLVYEVSFQLSNKEYEYDINAKDGNIINVETDIDDDYIDTSKNNNQTSSSSSNNSNSNSTASSIISQEKAKSIAFKDAGVSASNVYDLEIELDTDDGKKLYEIEFKLGNTEYKYDIDAKSGSIIKKEIDKDDD